jgi:hypothetical protein
MSLYQADFSAPTGRLTGRGAFVIVELNRSLQFESIRLYISLKSDNSDEIGQLTFFVEKTSGQRHIFSLFFRRCVQITAEVQYRVGSP